MSKFMEVYEPVEEGIGSAVLTFFSWAFYRDQSRVDKFFETVGHVNDFLSFADFLYDNIKATYKTNIHKECPEPFMGDKYWPTDCNGKIGDYWVSVNLYTNPIKNPVDPTKRNCIGIGYIGLFDYKRIKHTDGHWRHIGFFVTPDGLCTFKKDTKFYSQIDDGQWLLETRRIKIPYFQSFTY